MKSILRILLPLLILSAALLFARWLINSRAEPKKRSAPPTITKVDATRVVSTSQQIILRSQGSVRPRTEGSLASEVSGTVINVSPSFREGGFFEKGDILMEIDPLNYETAKIVAEGQIAQTSALLAEENARADQALANWRSLGKKGDPSELVLRKPQLAEATARAAAAQAQLEKATRDLEKTKIRAPYAGRILSKSADLGQYVNVGRELAMTYAVDYVEIRLPLSNEDLAYIDLPESYRGGEDEATDQLPPVTLTGDIGGEEISWQGKIVRVSGAIDSRSRQLFIVAQVDDPYGKNDAGTPPLKIGLFVEAAIGGRLLENVIILPSKAVRAEGDVIVIKDDNSIIRQQVTPLWRDTETVIISPDPAAGGLAPGTLVCLTPLSYPTNGSLVAPTIDGVAPLADAAGGGSKPAGVPPVGVGGGGVGPDFTAMDANGDGKIAKDEAPDRMQGRWDKVDTNGDGYLDKDEQSNFSSNMRGGA